MKPAFSIAFHEVEAPITSPVTKFGGQPVWIDGPEWPLSRETGNPMRFICQIALSTEMFGEMSAKMAHLFLTDEEEFVDGTFEPDGGENALIIQPQGVLDGQIQLLEQGPTLQVWVQQEGDALRTPMDKEFGVELSLIEVAGVAEEAWGNHVGGEPTWFQCEEFPTATETWRLILQLDSAAVPFDVNFGDAGVGYAFLSSDQKRGKFLWQCA